VFRTRDIRLIKARVLINLPPGARRGPKEGGECYQHFEEVVGALRAQVVQFELMHMGFQWILVVSWVGSLEIGVGARVRGGGG
jgi:hypothetical protein